MAARPARVAAPDPRADGPDLRDRHEAAAREALGEMQVLWDSATDTERRALKVIAQRTVALNGREAEQRFGLAKGGSTRVAVDRLVAEGHLVGDPAARTGWRIVDSFLGAWLRER
jgi:hypothetical protein